MMGGDRGTSKWQGLWIREKDAQKEYKDIHSDKTHQPNMLAFDAELVPGYGGYGGQSLQKPNWRV